LWPISCDRWARPSGAFTGRLQTQAFRWDKLSIDQIDLLSRFSKAVNYFIGNT